MKNRAFRAIELSIGSDIKPFRQVMNNVYPHSYRQYAYAVPKYVDAPSVTRDSRNDVVESLSMVLGTVLFRSFVAINSDFIQYPRYLQAIRIGPYGRKTIRTVNKFRQL
jgi:hypothetical protein